MGICRRCTECRKTFAPARSALSTQRVCSKACRDRRDRKLARARRRRDLDDARIDERARQRARRAHLVETCHALPPVPKCPLSPKEVRQFVDRALARSRANLVRDLQGILRRFTFIRGEDPTVAAAMSRATLGAEDVGNMADSGESLAGLSRMSLGVRAPP